MVAFSKFLLKGRTFLFKPLVNASWNNRTDKHFTYPFVLISELNGFFHFFLLEWKKCIKIEIIIYLHVFYSKTSQFFLKAEEFTKVIFCFFMYGYYCSIRIWKLTGLDVLNISWKNPIGQNIVESRLI